MTLVFLPVQVPVSVVVTGTVGGPLTLGHVVHRDE